MSRARVTRRTPARGAVVELSPLKDAVDISLGAFLNRATRIAFDTDELTDAELRQKLRAKKLPTKGTREQLIHRLNKALLKTKKPKK